VIVYVNCHLLKHTPFVNCDLLNWQLVGLSFLVNGSGAVVCVARGCMVSQQIHLDFWTSHLNGAINKLHWI
jgi:hypothetical protein